MTATASYASYEMRLNRVVDFIYDHLEEDIGLDRLAEIACLSPYHWHRIYTAMRGETIAATVKRLRLHRAADRLANSDLSIREVGKRAGYGSVESFSRAFKEAYGRSPLDYRANGSHAAFKAANAARDAAGFAVSIVDLPAMRCAGISHKGSYMEIDRAIGRLFEGLAARGLLAPGARMIALFFDDPDAVAVADLRAKACSPIGAEAEPAAPLEETILRGGLYARLRYQGPYADMKDAYRWLFSTWLANSDHEAADAPVFEEYLNNPQEVPPNALLTDIHLPLEGRI
jgi:AraC family transcriptional regulator